MARNAEVQVARGLSRSQVAELLRLSEQGVAKLDGRILHPVRSLDRRWLYDVSEVRALLERSAEHDGRKIGAGIVDGEVTAVVFKLFETGKTLPQVVIETKEPPVTISALREEYDRLNGSLTLTPAVVAELRTAIDRAGVTADGLGLAVKHAIVKSFEEGQKSMTDYGEVRDGSTGQMRPVCRPRRSSVPDNRVRAADAEPAGRPTLETAGREDK